MFDSDLAFKVFGQPVSYLGDNDILPPICINKDRSCYYEEQQCDQYPFNYFLEGLQKQGFRL